MKTEETIDKYKEYLELREQKNKKLNDNNSINEQDNDDDQDTAILWVKPQNNENNLFNLIDNKFIENNKIINFGKFNKESKFIILN